MNETGWGWPASEIRRTRLIEWIVQECAKLPVGQATPVTPFYSALADQDMNMSETARDDLDFLERESLVQQLSGMGGIEALAALPTGEGRAHVERLQAARTDNPRRRHACRDAMVDWLYSRDAVEPPGVAREEMLNDPARGRWFGEPFTEGDLESAAAWLKRQGMADGIMVEEDRGPIVVCLTDTGTKCAEDFGSDTAGYLERQGYREPAPVVSIGTHTGPLQVARDYATQTQNIGASANDLRVMISGITDIVRALVPDVPDADGEEQLALVAVGENHLDRSALERFRDWTISTVRAGATSAAVAVVSSATTTLLIEAGRLAGHLG